MSTATLVPTDLSRPVAPASSARTGYLADLNPAAVSAGLTAFFFYVTAGVPLLLLVAGRLGLDTAHTSSWFFIVFFTTATTSFVVSLVYRQPLPINWSFPSLLYLASLAGQFAYPELVGANLMAGALIVLVGVFGLGRRLLLLLPLPIALGMFAGSILGNLVDLVGATLDDALVAGAIIAGYLLGRLVNRREVPPVALAALSGIVPILVTHRIAPTPVVWSLPVVLVPEMQFSLSALVTISLPLVVLSVGLGNVQGLGFLEAQGYRVSATLVTVVVGIQSIVNAIFGGHQACVGRSGVAILASAEAGPMAGRYWASLIANALLLPIAFAAGPIGTLLALVPHSYVIALAGLAVWPSFQEALGRSLSGRLRFGATVAFVVAASPFAPAGIPSALWALVAGLLVSVIAERGDLEISLKERIVP